MDLFTEERQKLFNTFEKCIQANFLFLSDMDYRLNRSNMGWEASFSSTSVTLNIYYERVSFEIYSTIVLKENHSEYSVWIDDILPLGLERQFRYATQESTVEKAIVEIRDLIQRYGKNYLDGDVRSFRAIIKKKSDWVRDQDLLSIEHRARDAWNQGDYETVVALYKFIQKDLKPFQKRIMYLAMKEVELEEETDERSKKINRENR
ncbi:MAG: hypothetical protein FWE87_06590 [Coriobacteriia bacterium]|nr:hypothetical protein [Coriobacteriia bacterium]